MIYTANQEEEIKLDIVKYEYLNIYKRQIEELLSKIKDKDMEYEVDK